MYTPLGCDRPLSGERAGNGGKAVTMRGEVGDPYARLLAQWQARREMVEAYHRALRFLPTPSGATPPPRDLARRELNEKLALALVAVRQASDQLRLAEQGRAASAHP